MNNSSLLADVSGIPYFCFKKDEKVFIITCISRWNRFNECTRKSN